jgi:hypothetical protein
MATPAAANSWSQTNPLELEALQLLPCGCVTSVGRVRPWDFLVVSIEAKGPNCILQSHRIGRVVQLAPRSEEEEDEDDLG